MRIRADMGLNFHMAVSQEMGSLLNQYGQGAIGADQFTRRCAAMARLCIWRARRISRDVRDPSLSACLLIEEPGAHGRALPLMRKRGSAAPPPKPRAGTPDDHLAQWLTASRRKRAQPGVSLS